MSQNAPLAPSAPEVGAWPGPAPRARVSNRSFLNDWPLPRKVGVTAGLLLLPFGISQVQHLRDLGQRAAVQTEQLGALGRVGQALQLSAAAEATQQQIPGFLAGAPQSRQALESSLNAFTTALSTLSEAGEGELSRARLGNLEKGWRDLRLGVLAKSLSPEQTAVALSGVNAEVSALLADLQSESGLRRGGTELTALLGNLPAQTRALSELRVAAAVPDSPLTVREVAQASAALQSLRLDVDRLSRVDAAAGAELSAALSPLLSSTSGLLTEVERGLRAGRTDRARWQPLARASLSAQQGYQSALTAAGQAQLSAQRAQTDRWRWLTLALSVATLALAFWALRRFVQSLEGPLTQLTRASRQLALGDLNVRLPVTGTDELAVLGQQLNGAAGQWRQSQLRAERDRRDAARLQTGVSDLAPLLGGLGSGDLSLRAEEAEGPLATVGASLNRLTEQFAQVVQGAREAAGAAEGSAQQLERAAAEGDRGAALAAAQADALEGELRRNAERLRDIAQAAQAGQRAAQQARSASEEGWEAVQGSLNELRGARETGDRLEAALGTLSAQTAQLQGALGSLTQLSSQTQLLALHAAIEAVGAGEAGSRFSVIAEELRQLADQGAATTEEVGGLLGQLQTELGEVSAAAAQGAEQLGRGYAVTDAATGRLRELGELSAQTVTLVSQVATAGQEGERAAAEWEGRAEELRRSLEQARMGADQSRAGAQNLRQLADGLTRPLEHYRA